MELDFVVGFTLERVCPAKSTRIEILLKPLSGFWLLAEQD